MQKIFQHIRKQPKHVRENYAFGIASVFTTVVLLAWVVSRPQTGFLSEVSSQVSETAAPFSTLIKESKKQLAQLRGAIATTTAEQATSTPEAAPTAGAIVLTPEDISIANATTTATTENASTTPRAYVEVLIGTSSAALPGTQNTASSSPESAQ